MSTSRSIGRTLGLLALLVASMLPASPLRDGLTYLAAVYIVVDFGLLARSGYLRRRPHWTETSWRRFLMACSVPVGALVVMVSMMAAFERRLPIVGAAGSNARGLWAVGIMAFMILGVGGLVVAVSWLAQGDPTRQFGRTTSRQPGEPQ
ncbi:MAG: hypothetical protein ACYC5V_03725 [Gemmatimonadaceae bacterium]